MGHLGYVWVIHGSYGSTMRWVIWVMYVSTKGHMWAIWVMYGSTMSHVRSHRSCVGQSLVICRSHESYGSHGSTMGYVYGSYGSHYLGDMDHVYGSTMGKGGGLVDPWTYDHEPSCHHIAPHNLLSKIALCTVPLQEACRS